jgi:hypothetical protein
VGTVARSSSAAKVDTTKRMSASSQANAQPPERVPIADATASALLAVTFQHAAASHGDFGPVALETIEHAERIGLGVAAKLAGIRGAGRFFLGRPAHQVLERRGRKWQGLRLWLWLRLRNRVRCERDQERGGQPRGSAAKPCTSSGRAMLVL